MLILRLRVGEQTMPSEKKIHPDYSLQEVTEIINQAIERGEAVRLALDETDLKEGEDDVFKFSPELYQVVSIAHSLAESEDDD